MKKSNWLYIGLIIIVALIVGVRIYNDSVMNSRHKLFESLDGATSVIVNDDTLTAKDAEILKGIMLYPMDISILNKSYGFGKLEVVGRLEFYHKDKTMARFQILEVEDSKELQEELGVIYQEENIVKLVGTNNYYLLKDLTIFINKYQEK